MRLVAEPEPPEQRRAAAPSGPVAHGGGAQAYLRDLRMQGARPARRADAPGDPQLEITAVGPIQSERRPGDVPEHRSLQYQRGVPIRHGAHGQGRRRARRLISGFPVRALIPSEALRRSGRAGACPSAPMPAQMSIARQGKQHVQHGSQRIDVHLGMEGLVGLGELLGGGEGRYGRPLAGGKLDAVGAVLLRYAEIPQYGQPVIVDEDVIRLHVVMYVLVFVHDVQGLRDRDDEALDGLLLLEFPMFEQQILQVSGVFTVEELAAMGRAGAESLPGIGPKGMEEIGQMLESLGISFKDD